MPQKQMRTTHEQLEIMARAWYGPAKTMSEMVKQAIAERGGHCLSCECKRKLLALKPRTVSCVLRPQNLSVQVQCSIAPDRRYPFRDDTASPDQCPSLKHHMRLQQKTGIAV